MKRVNLLGTCTFLSVLLFSICCNNTVLAQSYGLEWAIATRDTVEHGSNITIHAQESDALGNTYITGVFAESADLDPTPGEAVVTSNTFWRAVFLAKYDATGALVWAREVINSYDVQIRSMEVDAAGNVYLVSEFFFWIRYQPENPTIQLPAVFSTSWRTSGYLIKYDPDGNFMWVNRLDSDSEILPKDVSVSADGSVYVTGSFKVNASFGSPTMPDTLIAVGDADVFVVKYDEDGTYAWSRAFGGSQADVGFRIASDDVGNVCLLASVQGSVDVDPSSGSNVVTPIGTFDANYANVLVRFDAAGAFEWSQLFQGQTGGLIHLSDVSVGPSGNIYLTGVYGNYMGQQVDFDFGPGTSTLPNTSYAFVATYAPNADFVWAQGIGPNTCVGKRLSVHSDGSVVVGGNIITPSTALTPRAFLGKLDASGALLYYNPIRNDDEITNAGISVNAAGTTVVSYNYNGVTDIDPGPGTYLLSPLVTNNSSIVAFYDGTGALVDGFSLSDNDAYGGGMSSLNTVGTYLEMDVEGNGYVRGFFNATTDFDAGPGETVIANQTGIFFAKYDSLSAFQWVLGMDSVTRVGGGLSLDASGHPLLGLTVDGTSDINPLGAPVVYVTPFKRGVLAKYAPTTGVLEWHKALEPLVTLAQSEIQDVVIDSAGNIFVIGKYYGEIDFDPSAATYSMSSGPGSKGFLAKYDGDGNFIWVHEYAQFQFVDLAVNTNNDLFIAGRFTGTIDADPSSGTFFLTATGGENTALIKLESDATFQWGFALASTLVYRSTNVQAGENHVYLCSNFNGSCDVDPGPGTTTLTASAESGFIARYDANDGSFDWGFNMPNCHSVVTGLDLDTNENIAITGAFRTNIWSLWSQTPPTSDLDPVNDTTPLQTTLYPGGFEWNPYIALYDSTGAYIWATNLSGVVTYNYTVQGAIGFSVSENKLLTTGGYVYAMDFAPKDAVFLLQTTGRSEAYLAKYSICAPTGSSLSATACGSYDYEGVNYLTSGTYYRTFSNYRGCDSIVTLNLTILPMDTVEAEVVSCSPYTWSNGQTYNNSGTYYQYLTNTSGCDSVSVLHLTVASADSVGTTLAACESYDWDNGQTYTTSGTYYQYLTNSYGCDSVSVLQLTIHQSDTVDQTITACDQFLWDDGQTYTASGTYYQYLTTSNGCDSLVRLTLTIESVDESVVVVNDSTLQATATGVNYQWLDCFDFSAISGANQAVFTPDYSGTFAVVVSNGTCTDTSACFVIETVGLSEPERSDVFIYPNPTDGEVTIRMENHTESGRLVLTDLRGTPLLEQSFSGNSEVVLDLQVPAGTYLLQIRFDGGTQIVRKVVVQ